MLKVSFNVPSDDRGSQLDDFSRQSTWRLFCFCEVLHGDLSWLYKQNGMLYVVNCYNIVWPNKMANILPMTFSNVYFYILIQISLKLVPSNPIHKNPALVHVKVWYWRVGKPLLKQWWPISLMYLPASPSLSDLTFTWSFQMEHKHIFTFYIIPLHCYDTGSWNPSSSKTRTNLFCIVNIMGADVLARQGARTSATMILT